MSLIFIYTIILHAVWGVLLIVDERTSWVTAINSVDIFDNMLIEPIMLIGASCAALYSLIRDKVDLLDLFMLLPQQAVLSFSLVGATQAILTSSFADGVIRPRCFIAADQSPAILIFTLHTYAVWKRHSKFIKSAKAREKQLWIQP